MPVWPIHCYVLSYPYSTSTKKIVKRKQNGLGKGGHLCILSTEDSCSLAHKFLY